MSVTTCVVSGTLVDNGGNAMSGATIEASNTVPYFYGDGTQVMPYKLSTTSSVSGTWSLTLIENTSTTTSTRISITFPDGSGGNSRRDYTIIVTNTGTANFSTLAAGQ